MVRAFRFTKRLLRETPIEILALGVVGAAVGGFAFHRAESNRAYAIPVGFSEIAEIEKSAAQEGASVGPLTSYLTAANDVSMLVFDAWNSSEKHPRSFATELERRSSQRSFGRKDSLNYRLGQLPVSADAAMAALDDFVKVRQKAGEAATLLDKAWEDTHHDNSRHVCRTVEDTDGKTREDCAWEYDDTTHTYTYYLEHGEAAAEMLNRIASEHGNLRLTEQLRATTVTTPQNEVAAERSRPSKNGKRPSKEELLSYANEWNSGSTLASNLPRIYSLADAIKEEARAWSIQKNSAQSTSYRTGRHSDPGPAEFQLAEKAMNDTRQLGESIGAIISGIEHTKSAAPVLEQKISQFIAVEAGLAEGNPKELRGEIINTAKQMYTANFSKGFEVNRFRAWMTFLGVIAGAAAGAAVGGLLEYGENRFKWYDEKLRKHADPRFGQA